jgi:type IV secretory pathway VirB2 component (pilin)
MTVLGFAGKRRANARPRNTAPMWKKLSIVLSGPIAASVVISLLGALKWPFPAFLALVVVVVAGVVWLMSKLLNVHLSLRSWD